MRAPIPRPPPRPAPRPARRRPPWIRPRPFEHSPRRVLRGAAADLMPGAEVLTLDAVAGATVGDLAGATADEAAAPPGDGGEWAAPPWTGARRVVIGAGEGVVSRLAHLEAACLDRGMGPAVVAAAAGSMAGAPAAAAVDAVAARYAAAHGLHVRVAGAGGTPPLAGARVAMNLVLDQGTVPTPEGGAREDGSHVVVLDGMYTEEERRGLMEWLTGGTDDAAGPLEGRWGRTCSDFNGQGRESWGLTEEAAREAAAGGRMPPALAAVLSRVAGAYPEYDVCLMPGEALGAPEEWREEGEGDLVHSPVVANAVAPGEHYDWHLDMDPSRLHPCSPWATHHGLYCNRERDRPLFVTAMVYPQSAWPEDWDAETLFLDPATQTGVAVRPAPYRVVLMDQDVCHRISGPSRRAPGPRYSLVWKLVFVPRERGTFPTLARAPWGPPVRFGSAAPGPGLLA